MKKFKIVAALSFSLLAASPAFSAKMKATSCTDANIAKTDAMIAKLADGENKTMKMQAMTAAKSSMSQKDMAGCEMQMSKAMKAETTKSK